MLFGAGPTGIGVPTTTPVAAFNSVTVPSLEFATQTWVPSDEMASGPERAPEPTEIGAPTTTPVVAFNSVTVPSPLFATQTCVPSEETAVGLTPTGMVLITAEAEAGI